MKIPFESRRFFHQGYRDWEERIRVVFSLAGEGETANLDRTVAQSGADMPEVIVTFQERIEEDHAASGFPEGQRKPADEGSSTPPRLTRWRRPDAFKGIAPSSVRHAQAKSRL